MRQTCRGLGKGVLQGSRLHGGALEIEEKLEQSQGSKENNRNDNNNVITVKPFLKYSLWTCQYDLHMLGINPSHPRLQY